MSAIPSIKVSNPQLRDPTQLSPTTPREGEWDGEFRRPTSPASKKGAHSRERGPMSPISAVSPTKVLRSLSGNASIMSNDSATQGKDGTGAAIELTVTVDPVSQQIYNRTGDGSPSTARQNSADTSLNAGESDGARRSRSPAAPPRVDTGMSVRSVKSRDNKVSFFSRIIGGKKKDHPDQVKDDVSIADDRPEGKDAEIFSPVTAHSEFQPHKSLIPSYIRVRTRHSRKKHLDSLVFAQELMAGVREKSSTSARRKSSALEVPTIWSAEFSKDGKYLATAGSDKIIRVWKVLATPEERRAEMRRTSGSSLETGHGNLETTAQVFHSQPIREYKGHSSAVLDLSWSKNNFLLSASMDKTVRLWHVSRPETLCTFKHSDFVPSIAFHPKDDRFFLTGSLDRKLRLWSIPEKHVAFWTQLPEMITAVAFTPDGKNVIAGSSDGLLMFYETEGLKYQTQTRVKSANSKDVKGSKITGIQAYQHTLGSSNGDAKVLVTSNDSRVRLYNFRDKSLEVKLRGCVNSSSQIRASMSADYRYICSGSEDSRAYIWPIDADEDHDPTKRPLEHFQAHDSVVTCVRFAPPRTRQILAGSADPIYDLCEPASARAQLIRRSSSQSSSRAPTENGESVNAELSLRKCSSPRNTGPQSHHPDGNIIVTTSITGAIKVFRQDCAAHLRAPKSSSMKRVGSMTVSRPASLRTRSSNHSLQSGRHSTSTQPPGERIMSWRQSIATPPSVRTESISSKHSTRSLSPRKSTSGLRSVSGPAAPGRPGPGNKTPTDSFVSSTATTPNHSNAASPHFASDLKMTKITPDPSKQPKQVKGTPPRPSTSPTRSNSKPAATAPPFAAEHTAAETNPLMLQGEQSNLFWNVALHKEAAIRAHKAYEEAEKERLAESWHSASEDQDDGRGRLRVDGGRLNRVETAVSKLSIERSASPGSSVGEGASRSVSVSG